MFLDFFPIFFSPVVVVLLTFYFHSSLPYFRCPYTFVSISSAFGCHVFSEAPDDHHDPEPVAEVSNAIDHYPQTSRHEKIADLFYNPGNVHRY